jgi:hypothetical protein
VRARDRAPLQAGGYVLPDSVGVAYVNISRPVAYLRQNWVDRTSDLDYHLRPATLGAPGGRRELDELIGAIAGTPLDP